MPFTPEQIEYNKRLQEEQRQLEERQQAAAQVEAVKNEVEPQTPLSPVAPETQVPNPISPAGDTAPTPEEVALGVKDDQGNYQPTPNTAQQIDRPEGPITALGNAASYIAGSDGGGGLAADVLNAGASVLNTISGNNLQGLDDAVLGSEELKKRRVEIAEALQQKRDSGEMSPVEQGLQTTTNALEGISTGMESGLALPVTIAARLLNNDAPWSDPPATLKNSPVGQTLHSITEILVPTVLTSGVFGAGAVTTGAVGLNVESAIETFQQESFEDLIAGRSLAGKFGEFADQLGLDGSQLTKELIEGQTIPSQLFTAVVGHAQNLGINFGFNQVYKRIHGQLPKPTPEHEQAAKVTGKSAEDVQLELDFNNPPVYKPYAEPHEGTDIDTGVVSIWHGTSKGRMQAILDKGFKPSKRSLNIMGEGVYFTTDSRYAGSYGDYYIQGQTSGLNITDLEGRSISEWAEEIGIGKPEILTDWEGMDVSQLVWDSLDPEERAIYFSEAQKLALAEWAKKNGVDGVRYDSSFEQALEGPVDELIIFDPAKASKAAGIGGINPVAFTTEALRKAGIAEDGLLSADRQFFTNWKAITDTEGMNNALQVATSTLKKIKETTSDTSRLLFRAKAGGAQIKAALELDDYGTAAKLYRQNFTSGIGDIPERIAKKDVDTRNQGTYFHGSATEITELDDFNYTSENIYGQGFYVTDDFTTAKSYTKKNRRSAKKAGQEVANKVYKIRENTPIRFYDLNTAGISNDVMAVLDDAAGYNPAVERAIPDLTESTSLGEAMDIIRSYSRSTETSRETIQETFESVQDLLRQQGYGGYTHTGGVLTKNKRKHNVRIYWEPKDQISIDEVPESFSRRTTSDEIPDEAYLREFAQVNEDGFTVAGLIAEELGVRIMKAARVADNLENIGVDFTKAVENLLDLHDKAGLFLTPMRRAKRRWSLEGTGQQRKTIRKLKDADIQDAMNAEPRINMDSSYRDFDAFQVKGVDGADRNTIRELYDLYKSGDSEAGQSLKAYINIVAHSNPNTVLTNVVDLTKTATDNLKLGTTDAVKALLYAARLSRLSTQITANVNTTLNSVGLGIGNMLSGVGPAIRGDWSEAAYGWGEFLGGMDSLQDSWKATRRAFTTGESMKSSPGKVDMDLTNLKLRQAILTDNYKNVLRRLNDTKAPTRERWSASLHYWTQMAGNSPIVNFGSRALMAADEGHLVINGGQVAKGRAFQEAVRTGTFNNKGELERLTQVHLSRIFDEGKRTGKILDEEVLQLNRKITFTDRIGAIGEELPKSMYQQAAGGVVDGFFSNLDEAAKNNLMWNIVSPFTRVTYEALEAFVRYEPSGFFRTMHPRYKALMDGKYGETARLQLRSNIAVGWLAVSSMIATAYARSGTGEEKNSNLPKRSFIIPAPGTSKGYIAMSYEKLEPWSTLFASTADMVNGLRREVVSYGAYDRFIHLMVTSIGMSLLDKNFTSSMQRFFDFLDVSRIAGGGAGIAASTAGMAGTFVPRAFDMLGDFANPYKSLSVDDNALGVMVKSFVKSNLGGLGLPHDYDELTGEKIPKSATLGDGENFLTAQTAEIVGELGWAGNVTDFNFDHPVKKDLNKVMFKPKTLQFYKQYEGVPLSTQQVSDLKRGMSKYGMLAARLNSYFDSKEFARDFGNLNKYRKNKHKGPLGPVPKGSEADKYLQKIHQKIEGIYQAAKDKSAKATIFRDISFIEKLQLKNITDYRKAR